MPKFQIIYYNLDDRRDEVEQFDDWQEARTRYNVLQSLRRTGEHIMEIEFRGEIPFGYC